MKLGRHENEFYKFAVIKQSKFSNKKEVFDLVRYDNFNDTIGKELWITHSFIADLQKYTGVYTLVAFNLDMRLEIRDGKLLAIVPGDEESEFLLISENVFTVKGKQDYTISFQLDGNKPKGFTSVQPNRTFQATFKNK